MVCKTLKKYWIWPKWT